MRHSSPFLLAIALVFSSIEYAHGQVVHRKTAAKPVVKTLVSGGLTLEGISHIYSLQQLPELDEYLTSHNWVLRKTISSDSIDEVTYSRNLFSPNPEILTAIFCNRRTYRGCIKPELHQGTVQHIYQIKYNIKKPIFDKLQKEIRAAIKPTHSAITNESIAMIYRYENKEFVFRTTLEEGTPKYYAVFFIDVDDEE